MPVYTYYCERCKEYEEASRPIPERDASREHSCGATMKRVYTPPLPHMVKLYGNDMARDTLNSGHALPNRWYKNKYETLAAKGLERPEKTIW